MIYDFNSSDSQFHVLQFKMIKLYVQSRERSVNGEVHAPRQCGHLITGYS